MSLPGSRQPHGRRNDAIVIHRARLFAAGRRITIILTRCQAMMSSVEKGRQRSCSRFQASTRGHKQHTLMEGTRSTLRKTRQSLSRYNVPLLSCSVIILRQRVNILTNSVRNIRRLPRIQFSYPTTSTHVASSVGYFTRQLPTDFNERVSHDRRTQRLFRNLAFKIYPQTGESYVSPSVTAV